VPSEVLSDDLAAATRALGSSGCSVARETLGFTAEGRDPRDAARAISFAVSSMAEDVKGVLTLAMVAQGCAERLAAGSVASSRFAAF